MFCSDGRGTVQVDCASEHASGRREDRHHDPAHGRCFPELGHHRRQRARRDRRQTDQLGASHYDGNQTRAFPQHFPVL